MWDPVCASNGITYGNMCFFEVAQCKSKLICPHPLTMQRKGEYVSQQEEWIVCFLTLLFENYDMNSFLFWCPLENIESYFYYFPNLLTGVRSIFLRKRWSGNHVKTSQALIVLHWTRCLFSEAAICRMNNKRKMIHTIVTVLMCDVR